MCGRCNSRDKLEGYFRGYFNSTRGWFFPTNLVHLNLSPYLTTRLELQTGPETRKENRFGILRKFEILVHLQRASITP